MIAVHDAETTVARAATERLATIAVRGNPDIETSQRTQTGAIVVTEAEPDATAAAKVVTKTASTDDAATALPVRTTGGRSRNDRPHRIESALLDENWISMLDTW